MGFLGGEVVKVNVNFRLEREKLEKLKAVASGKRQSLTGVLTDAVNEYLALYVVGEPTVGRLKRKVDDVEKRLEALENFLLKKGAESVF